MTVKYRRAAGVAVRAVGSEIFAARERPRGIHYLDPIAAGVWRALSEPKTVAELRALLRAAFPHVPPRRVGKDTQRLLDDMIMKKLIRCRKSQS